MRREGAKRPVVAKKFPSAEDLLFLANLAEASGDVALQTSEQAEILKVLSVLCPLSRGDFPLAARMVRVA
jgi:hypothetical protein